MPRVRSVASFVFVAAAATGSILDRPHATPPRSPAVLTGDFHVHGMPGDGALPVWELQREAARRGLDVIAITNHDDNVSMRLAQASGLLKPYPIVIPGQEVTAFGFHMAAVGVRKMVSPRLRAREAVEAIHTQGGVAIAAHPVPQSWIENDDAALAILDGAEVMHPSLLGRPRRAAELLEFFERARAMNADIAPIGSTDFHGGGPLGLCRTYLIVDDVSEAGVLEAIRRGRTVASGPGDRLIGAEEHLTRVRAHQKPPQPTGFRTRAALPAAAALLSLGIFVLADRRSA